MAKGSKRQRKKTAKRLGTWEGNQYRGGRGKGKKNLKKVPEGYQNKHGVTFTPEHKKALERAVDRSNYRRKKMLELKTHDKVRRLTRNDNQYFKNTTANSVTVWEVTRVNKNTYSMTCIEGYLKGSSCKLQKGYTTWVDSYYKTITTWEKA